MPRFEEQRVLPYPRDFLFEIIADVGKYPEFLPWCTAARVYNRKGDRFLADIVIGFKMLHESWTSEVTLEPPNRVISNYIKGPMKHLRNRWELTPHAEGTLVDIAVDFEFKNPILAKLMGSFFEDTSHRMIGAFEKRARALSKQKGT